MTSIECKCDYGKKGENLTNVQYELPTVKPLQCKKGQFDSKGFGGTLVGECKDEDQGYYEYDHDHYDNDHYDNHDNANNNYCSHNHNNDGSATYLQTSNQISGKKRRFYWANDSCFCHVGHKNENVTFLLKKMTFDHETPSSFTRRATSKFETLIIAILFGQSVFRPKMCGKCMLFVMGITFLSLCLNVLANDYVKNAFAANSKEIIADILTGAGLGASLGSAGGPEVIIGGAAVGVVIEAAKNLGVYVVCKDKLGACQCRTGTCVQTEDGRGVDFCCGDAFEWKCYCEWNEIVALLTNRFPDFKQKEEVNKAILQTVPKVDYIENHVKEIRSCHPEKTCGHCGARFECVQQRKWRFGTGCCPPGTKMTCCVTTTTTTTPSTTTTTTTTTMTTTTTTDENLFCKKAFFEQHPEDNKYEEEENKKCARNERHCYVLNCTTVTSTPSFDRFIGYKVEWGCSVTKESFKENFNQGKGRMGSGRFPGSKCNDAVGPKYYDMANVLVSAPLFNPTHSSLWCKGGHFWKKNHHGKNISVCNAHEHYCYVLNCTLALVGESGSTESEHHVFTKWGCTDKKPSKLLLDNPGQFIGESEANRITFQNCTPNVGKVNVSMSNKGIEVSVPAKICKKASKWLTYNESFDKSCSPSQRYCYVLNCSTAFEGDKKPGIMTEWGCTDKWYRTDDFLQGKGRQLAETQIGPIPNNFTCNSSVTLNSNEDIMLPIFITANTSNSALKCKQGRETPESVNDSEGRCSPDAIVCYAIHCFNIQSKKRVKEWGCSNTSQICYEKGAELGFNVSDKDEECHCFVH
ncbi:hypothetical protein GPALN_004177 [Globodera pallida]|nr:hypothetical protein GPALN_004177 [Globodera pallida]